MRIIMDQFKPISNNESYWNDLRKELRVWLQSNAPSLGILYEGTLKILFIDGFPGKEIFVAHAVREIRNRLPDHIIGVRIRKRVEYVNKLDSIVKEWERIGISLDGTLPLNLIDGGQIPSDRIELPRKLYIEITSLLREHKDSRETKKDVAIRLFEGIAPENKGLGHTLQPILTQWLDEKYSFVGIAHGESITEKELMIRFENFENIMAGLIRGFFKTLKGLDEILEDTNN